MSPDTQERVRRYAAEHGTPIGSKQVARALDISASYTRRILAALVARGVLDVANGEGGRYVWTLR